MAKPKRTRNKKTYHRDSRIPFGGDSKYQVRNYLSFAVIALMVLLTLMAAVQSGALAVLEKVSPYFTAVILFFFGTHGK